MAVPLSSIINATAQENANTSPKVSLRESVFIKPVHAVTREKIKEQGDTSFVPTNLKPQPKETTAARNSEPSSHGSRIRSRGRNARDGTSTGSTCNVIRGEDLPASSTNDHAMTSPKNGRVLNKGELDSIQEALGFPDASYFSGRLQEINSALCPGKSPAELEDGGYLVMATAMKLWLMPAQTWKGCNEATFFDDKNQCVFSAGKVYGALKIAGREEDDATVRQLLEENGGTIAGLCDKMLAVLWGVKGCMTPFAMSAP